MIQSITKKPTDRLGEFSKSSPEKEFTVGHSGVCAFCEWGVVMYYISFVLKEHKLDIP